MEEIKEKLKELKEEHREKIEGEVRKKLEAENKLEYSESELETVFDNMGEGIALFGTSGRIVKINKKILEIGGYTQEEVVGKKFNLLRMFPPKSIAKMISGFTKVVSGQRMVFDEGEVYTKTGEKKIINVKASPLMKGGKIAGVIALIRDVSERKKSEEELENVFNLSPNMICVCTPEGKFLKVSPSCEKILGYKEDEILKLGWAKLVHQDDVERTNKEVEKQLKGSPAVNFVNRYKCKDGSYATLEWQATFAKGGIVYATASDITERKKAEETLKESEEKFRTLFEKANDAITFIGKSGKIVEVNNEAVEIFGDTKKELVGKYFFQLDIFKSKDVADIQAKFAQIFEGRPVTANFTIKNKKGKEIHLENTGNVLSLGNETGVLIISRDVTKQKKAEEELLQQREEQQIILDSVPAMIFYKDKKDRVVRANKSLADAFQMPIDEMIGKTAAELNPGKDQWEADKRVMKTGQPIRNMIVSFKTPEGTKWFQVDKIPYRDTNGNIIGIIGFAVDITKQKKAEENLREKNAELERFAKLVIGREEKMIELKKRIAELERK